VTNILWHKESSIWCW